MITTMKNDGLLLRWKDVLLRTGRPAYRLGISVSIGCLIIGILSVPHSTGTLYSFLKDAQLFSFIAVGCWLAFQRKKSLSALVSEMSDGRLLFATSLAIIVFLGLMTIYLLVNSTQLFMAVASAGAFILPTLIIHQFDLLAGLPETHFEPWALPVPTTSRKAVIALNSQTIHVKVAPTYFQPHELTIELVQPSREKLGRAFVQAMNLYKSGTNDNSISLVDEHGDPFLWEFYRQNKLIGGRVYLDPEKTLIENNIKEKAVFTAKRVRQ